MCEKVKLCSVLSFPALVLVLTFYDLGLVFTVIRNPSRLDDSTHYMYDELFNSRRRFV